MQPQLHSELPNGWDHNIQGEIIFANTYSEE